MLNLAAVLLVFTCIAVASDVKVASFVTLSGPSDGLCLQQMMLFGVPTNEPVVHTETTFSSEYDPFCNCMTNVTVTRSVATTTQILYNIPTGFPIIAPSARPTTRMPTSRMPTITFKPTKVPTFKPTVKPTRFPTHSPAFIYPTVHPTGEPSERPTVRPTEQPTVHPTVEPSEKPTNKPTTRPTKLPSIVPTKRPTVRPTQSPTVQPTKEPSEKPTIEPTTPPTVHPTIEPSESPTIYPSESPTVLPSKEPTDAPTVKPTKRPTVVPTTFKPTLSLLPTVGPTIFPTVVPTIGPTIIPSQLPSVTPTISPTKIPTNMPTVKPTVSPTVSLMPTIVPTITPSRVPTVVPTTNPTALPSIVPTIKPTTNPSVTPTALPSIVPTIKPTVTPSTTPTIVPTIKPTTTPTIVPTLTPTAKPTVSLSPTVVPTTAPTTAYSHGFVGALAGVTGSIGYSGNNGPATSAMLATPGKAITDTSGNVYFLDTNNYCIRRIAAGTGIITVVAGTPTVSGTYSTSSDGAPATSVALSANNPYTGMHLDTSGVLYFTNTYSYRLMKVVGGKIYSWLGNGVNGNAGDGGSAASTSMGMQTPWSFWFDTQSQLYIAGEGTNVRKVDSSGIINNFVGMTGYLGFSGDGGPAVNAQVNTPWRAMVDSTGDLYITDQWNYRVRYVNSAGIIDTYLGNGALGYSGENTPRTATSIGAAPNLVPFMDLAVDDTTGDLLITDEYQWRLKSVSRATGLVRTIAGTGVKNQSGNGGRATSATLIGPNGIYYEHGTGRVIFSDYWQLRYMY